MSQITNILRFGREVKEEARRVTWPTLRETRGMAIMVLILVTLVSLFLVAIDLVIGFCLTHLLGLNF